MNQWSNSNPAHEQVELILQSVDALPTLSPVASRVLNIGSSDRADFGELTRLIESDPALTSKIIGLCRRAALGLGDRITTVKRALVMLGFEAVRAAVLSVSVYEVLDDEARHRDEAFAAHDEPEGLPDSDRRFDRMGFWMYSLGVASAAEMLAASHRRSRVNPDEAFVAGLLHGLGKPVLDLLLPRAYGRVIELAEERRVDAAEVEREVLGIDHHSAGRRIAERWGLPSTLRDVVWLYDHPVGALPEGVDAEAIRLVSVARALTCEMHLGVSGNYGPSRAAEEAGVEAGISKSTLDDVSRRLSDAVSERSKVLGLDEQAPPEILLRSITAANRRLAQLTSDLDARAREGARVAKVLDAIGTFWDSGGESGDLLRTLGAMTRSASRLRQPGNWMVILDRSRAGGWMLCSFDQEGTPTRSVNVQAPADLAAIDLTGLEGWGSPTGIRAKVARWAWDQVGLSSATTRLHVIPSSEGEQARGCLLVTDAEPIDEAPDERHMLPLRAGWSAALSASIHRAATERLAESLADSNRALAATQAKLTEAQALARLGEMTAGAAHEMNNPLTVILGRAQMLASRLEEEADASAARRIADAAADLSDLVSALHEIARPGMLHRSNAELGALLDQAICLAHEGAREGEGDTENPDARVRVEWAEEGLGPTTPVFADADRLARALGELIRNAREWSGEGNVSVRAHIGPGDGRLVIRIEDDGPGLSSKASRHAFDPFFSERPAGRGKGLGLPRARGLVELHGGTVRLEPGKPGGTTAIVTLDRWRPATDRRAERAA